MNYHELSNSFKFSARIAEETGGRINNVDLLRKASKAIVNLLVRAEKAERERDYAIKQLKIAADEIGGCWGCKWFDDMTEKCANPEGMVSCSTVTNNMWEWRGLKEE